MRHRYTGRVTSSTARRPTTGEEIANAVTHGIGLLAAVAGLVVLAVIASRRGDAWQVVGCTVFGATLILLYAASTIYHSIPSPRARPFLQALDHSAIYLLIAGTYTPFALVSLRGPWGWTLLGVVWSCAVLGVVLRATVGSRWRVFRVVLYVVMGWLVVLAARPLVEAVPARGVLLLVLGGVAYTAGIVFYACRSLPYHHAIWHLFVIAGSTLHFFAVLLSVLPRVA